MPRINPISFKVSPKDKAFLYNTIKTFSESLKRAKVDVIKLALKFPPGTTPVRLQDWERQVIVQWLLKLHKLAEFRGQEELKDRFRGLIEIFK